MNYVGRNGRLYLGSALDTDNGDTGVRFIVGIFWGFLFSGIIWLCLFLAAKWGGVI